MIKKKIGYSDYLIRLASRRYPASPGAGLKPQYTSTPPGVKPYQIPFQLGWAPYGAFSNNTMDKYHTPICSDLFYTSVLYKYTKNKVKTKNKEEIRIWNRWNRWNR